MAINLKEAIAKNELAQFTSGMRNKYPTASKKYFHAVLKTMILGTAKHVKTPETVKCNQKTHQPYAKRLIP